MSGRPVLTTAAMRAAEERAIAAGATVGDLMERAGRAVAEAALRFAGNAEALVLCGTGNNGGDGYVAARWLRERGVAVRVAALGEPRTEAAIAARAAWGGPVCTLEDAGAAPLVIDALLGTGLSRSLDPPVCEALCRLCALATLRLAIDVPSGVATDTGAAPDGLPHFDLTVALGALKPAHLLLPAAERCGRVVVADIGIAAREAPLVELARPRLAVPPLSGNKYRRGKIVVVGGAMGGAAALSATAAQRAGAGYVELLGATAAGVPHALVQRDWSIDALADERVRAIVVGPGLGTDRSARDRLDAAFAAGKPLLLDADALTLVGPARHDRLRGHVLTPHWGEFVRLFGDDGRDRLAQARAAAVESGAVVVLKGSDSIVAHPDGRAAIAPLAPGWLASAGTGDVLSGIVGALLAQGLAPFEAAQAGVWLHARAARVAGPMLIADDLIAALPAAAALCL